jgi:isoquinoline 1-oxidoreductase subunit beta
VVGKDTWSAIKGRSLLRIDWDDGVHCSYDSAAFRAELEAAVLKPGGKEVRNEGDTYAALEKAAKKLQADYYVPHFAHASMEAPAATVRIAGGRCEVWAAVQSPQTARDRVAKRLDLPPEKVIVNVTLLGGGFGRKSKPDFVLEAALASQAMNGQPVKLTWTREDDLHHDYFHTVAAQHLEAGLDADSKIVAWLHRASEPTIISIFAPDPKQLAPFELGLGLVGLPYAIPNVRIENPASTAHVRTGWLRSVNNIQHAFARTQSFIAEIAHAQGRDHRDYLLELLGPDRLIDPSKINDTFNHGESRRAIRPPPSCAAARPSGSRSPGLPAPAGAIRGDRGPSAGARRRPAPASCGSRPRRRRPAAATGSTSCAGVRSTACETGRWRVFRRRPRP